ncbi:MAG: DegT/DnrJ/EryC1/StrS family aminotransferase [Candidatus Lindowbacteria bacterium]|nr:DegT/DnrJ/EryC1/StrS family aminotransferase [Candidatus Lindowbacteria bacterium]
MTDTKKTAPDSAKIVSPSGENERVEYANPTLGVLESTYVKEALDSTWISGGAFIPRFEGLLKEITGAKHAVALANGTAALHTALMAAGIKHGDEVITPALTFAAMASVTVLSGARPVFVDSDLETLGISPQGIRAAITNKTKAIIIFHPFGLCCEMDSIVQIATEHDLVLIEDSAQAFGSRYDDKHAGTFGDFGCFSFQSAKTITTGEGGVLLTNNDEKADWAQCFRNHGFLAGYNYWHEMAGLNYRMTNIQAAIGCAQLERWDEIYSKRNMILREYSARLGNIENIKVPSSAPGSIPHLWVQPVLLDKTAHPEGCQKVRQTLAARGIETRPFFSIPYDMPPYQKFQADCPHAKELTRQGFSLPTHAEMTSDEVTRVCDALEKAVL